MCSVNKKGYGCGCMDIHYFMFNFDGWSLRNPMHMGINGIPRNQGNRVKTLFRPAGQS